MMRALPLPAFLSNLQLHAFPGVVSRPLLLAERVREEDAYNGVGIYLGVQTIMRSERDELVFHIESTALRVRLNVSAVTGLQHCEWIVLAFQLRASTS